MLFFPTTQWDVIIFLLCIVQIQTEKVRSQISTDYQMIDLKLCGLKVKLIAISFV